MNKNVKQLCLALIAFLIAQLLLAAVLSFSDHNYFHSDNWKRYDSGLYLWIAEEGYTLIPCDDQNTENNVTEYCGNTGWFPGYPFLIRTLSFLGSATLIAVLLSKLFYILSLFVLAKIARLEKINLHSISFLLIAACFFGFIYYNSIFPISAVTFFALSAFWFYQRGSLPAAFLCVFLATTFYPSGFLLGISMIIFILLSKKEQRFNHSILFISGIAAGTLLVGLNYQLTVGDWMAFTKVQEKYGHGFNNPLSNMMNLIFHSPYLAKGEIRIFIYLQAILLMLFAILVSIRVFRGKLLRDSTCKWAYIYFLLYFIFEWTIAGDLSMYRSDALLLPSVLILKDARTNVLLTVLFVLLLIGIPMSYLFFESILV